MTFRSLYCIAVVVAMMAKEGSIPLSTLLYIVILLLLPDVAICLQKTLQKTLIKLNHAGLLSPILNVLARQEQSTNEISKVEGEETFLPGTK